MRSDVGVAVGLGLAAGMGHGALVGGADELRVFPQRAGLVVVPRGFQDLRALGQLVVRHSRSMVPGLGVDRR